jgi:hypothetical protein
MRALFGDNHSISRGIEMAQLPPKRIYFDSNILHGWPRMAYSLPWTIGLAHWMKAELFIPQTVEDELEGQFVRGGGEAIRQVHSAFKKLQNHSREVIDFQFDMPDEDEDGFTQSFRKRSQATKDQYKIITVPQPELPTKLLLEMAIKREAPFEEKSIGDKKFVTGLQDTAILFSILAHIKLVSPEDRCIFVSADGIFHSSELEPLLSGEAPKLEMYRSLNLLSEHLLEFVRGELRAEWDKESLDIEHALTTEKDAIAGQILPLLQLSDLGGRGTWKSVLHVTFMQIRDFRYVRTELPESGNIPPWSHYKRHEGEIVKISAVGSIDFKALTKAIDFFSAMLSAGQDYVPEPPKIEETSFFQSFNLSITGTVHEGKIGDFKVVSVEAVKY